MAAKFFVVISIAVFVTLAKGDDDCNCDNYNTEALWKFFAKISKELVKNEEDKDAYSVSPALLSPLLDCNCMENNRKRRDIPEHTEDVDAFHRDDVVADAFKRVDEEADSISDNNKADSSNEKILNAFRSKRSIQFNTKFCPSGYAKIGPFCVQESFLENNDTTEKYD